MNPLFLIDFYKVGHVWQYPKGTKRIWSNWTPRYTQRSPAEAVHFGLQYFIRKYLIEDFNEHFFNEPVMSVCSEYAQLVKQALGTVPDIRHLVQLHQLQRLPLTIYDVGEILGG